MVSASKCTATARYWLCEPSSLPIWALSCSTKRAAGTGVCWSTAGGSGGQTNLVALLHLHELALLDRIPLGQRALREHPDRTPRAARLVDAALRLGLLGHGGTIAEVS